MDYKYKPGMYVKIHGGKFDGHLAKIISEATVYDYPAYEVRIEDDEYYNNHDEPEEDLERTFQEMFELDIFPEDPILSCDCLTIPWGFESIKLAVYDNEGSGYPHFHFYKGCKPEGGIPNSKRAGGGCLCFESANYFTHHGHKDTMNKTEIKELINFLKSPVKNNDEIIVWKFLIMSWNGQNPDERQLPTSLEIPDYKPSMKTIQSDKKK